MRLLAAMLLLLVLVFQAPAAGPVSDDEIYDKVRIKIAGDREIGGERIEVKVVEGVVHLTGVVPSDKLRSRAEKVTKKVKGVQKVVNQIRTAPV